ncbi:hypothetical protein FHX76_000712 [Lysinibacter cavernae]|uniref:Uncharacterized protein n=1 Tax=Lysinibacter cavernae TaxID=1640652 RepID=A0A7X5QZF1_9MICO|nr:hypothetical protein [Lysinibacter cavernae]
MPVKVVANFPLHCVRPEGTHFFTRVFQKSLKKFLFLIWARNDAVFLPNSMCVRDTNSPDLIVPTHNHLPIGQPTFGIPSGPPREPEPDVTLEFLPPTGKEL